MAFRRVGRRKWSRKSRRNVVSFESLEARVLLTTVSWEVDADGFWDVGSNWSTGAVPGPGDVTATRQEAASHAARS